MTWMIENQTADLTVHLLGHSFGAMCVSVYHNRDICNSNCTNASTLAEQSP